MTLYTELPNREHGADAAVPTCSTGHTEPASAIRTDDSAESEFRRRIVEELPFLRRAARRWQRDPANADDLVQDTVLQALTFSHLWQPGSNLRAWLFTIMRNRFFAAAGRSSQSATILQTLAETDRGCALSSPEARLMLRDLERAVQRLPNPQRTVVLSICIEGKSYEATAQQMGISVGAVRCHLARARDRLRKAVDAGADHRSCTRHPIPLPTAGDPAIERELPALVLAIFSAAA